MKTIEIWKDLVFVDSEGNTTTMCDYLVSNFGNVKRFSTNKILKQSRTASNYRVINIKSCGVRINLLVHRLVAFAFIPNIENKPQVNHKNKIRYDNHVDNLEWVTRAENNIHASKTHRGVLTER
jgi:hypothetical protein